MNRYKDKAFWHAVFMRALKTFGQTLLATGSIAGVTTLAEIKAIDWPYVLVVSLLAAVFSVINNLVASIPEYEEQLPLDFEAELLDDMENTPTEGDENNEV